MSCVGSKAHTTSAVPPSAQQLEIPIHESSSHSLGFHWGTLLPQQIGCKSFFGKTLTWYIFLTASLIFNFNYIYMNVSLYGNVHMSSGLQGGQKGVLCSLELELHVAVSCHMSDGNHRRVLGEQ